MARRGRKRAPFKIKIRIETVYSLGALTFFALGGLAIISFSGQGALLQTINDALRHLFGPAALIVPFLFFSAGLVLTGAKWSFAKPQVLLGAVLLLISVSTLGEMGSVGIDLFQNVSSLIQPLGTYILFSTLGVASFLIISDTSIAEIFFKLGSMIDVQPGQLKEKSLLKLPFSTKTPLEDRELKIRGVGVNQAKKTDDAALKDASVGTKQSEFKVNGPQQKPPAAQDEDGMPGKLLVNSSSDQQIWEYPPVSLLDPKPRGKADRGDVKESAGIIEQTLQSFGIQAKVREVNLGPAVTQYALQISLGTKLSKITSLANDLALALAAPTGQIRIEAPIPGRSFVGIEIPNKTPEVVTMHKVMIDDNMKKHKSKLAVALGLNVSGQVVIADIAKMPHVLIAGATGSGKSVAVNSFLASMLFRASPNELKLILVDPKRVELTGYNDIPHLLTPVIVEPNKVVSALKWATKEMERRYKVFAEVGARNIESYNEMAGFQAMPYIVIVIDELADIMLFNPAEVEECITRIAQMARATGMHLVLATQRPSVDVITGLIKANIPTRIAFNVASMMDSRVIIDSPGAERLLGRGDMLYVPPDQAKPTRIQGTFVSDKEIHALIDYLRNTGTQPEYLEDITTKFQSNKVGGRAMGGTGVDASDDPLITQAVQVVMEYDRASASVLQRMLSVGYSRAARMIDTLHMLGIVSPPDGSKPRDVNMKAAQDYLATKQLEA
ncbi:MAG TPA: DNA translocase FtsK [Patescibacteria group bacterium]|nr:DNA translocase FtsK [Patescibacteria group bacterium]